MRSAAEMPVVTPSRASIDSQNAVPKLDVLGGLISGRRRWSQRSGVSARQIRPRPCVAMKLMISGVTFSAAMVRSPSFSRSSSSTTTRMRPARISSMASGTETKGIIHCIRRVLICHPGMPLGHAGGLRWSQDPDARPGAFHPVAAHPGSDRGTRHFPGRLSGVRGAHGGPRHPRRTHSDRHPDHGFHLRLCQLGGPGGAALPAVLHRSLHRPGHHRALPIGNPAHPGAHRAQELVRPGQASAPPKRSAKS